MTELPAICDHNVLEPATERAKLRSVGVVWRDQPLPAGCTPPSAAICIEVAPTGRSVLLVSGEVRYSGDDETLAQWFASGGLEFDAVDDLHAWVRGPLTDAYRAATAHGHAEFTRSAPGQRGASSGIDVHSITDVTGVEVPGDHKANSVDADTIERRLKGEVRGQNPAVRTIARRLREHLGRVRRRKPLTLFALGPTGVGKTLTAEQAAEVLADPDLVGEPYRYLRLDMSEYQEAHRVSQFLGAPQGYAGYGEGSVLIRALREHPRLFVLFDEIEKAHRDVLTALMNAMDAGRLGDPTAGGSNGEVDCREAIFFFTSNLDAEGILADLDSEAISDATAVDAVCRRRLARSGIASALIGRIRSFLVFDALPRDAVVEVAVLSAVRVAAEFGLEVREVEPAAISRLLAESDTSLGARPLEYAVDSLLADSFIDLAASGVRGEVRIVEHGSELAVVPVPSAPLLEVIHGSVPPGAARQESGPASEHQEGGEPS